MMKKALPLIVVLIFSAALSSCSNDEPDENYFYDFSPIVLKVKVENKRGQNLLAAKTPENIIHAGLFMIYDEEMTPIPFGWPSNYYPDETYASENSYKPGPATRDIMPNWFGAYIAPSFSPWSAEVGETIFIGEFDGEENGEQNVDLVLDGKVYHISFTNYVTYHKNNVSIDRHFYLNGEETPDENITIVM